MIKQVLAAISRLNMANNWPADDHEIVTETGLPIEKVKSIVRKLRAIGSINEFDHSTRANG